MFAALAKWLARRRGKAAAPAQDAASKLWLDELRRNELSLNARRRIAPEEPAKAPAIAHGSAQPHTDVRQIAAGMLNQPRSRPGAGTDRVQDFDAALSAGVASEIQNGGAAESGGAFGGAGASGEFGAAGADADTSSGDSGNGT